MVLDASKVRALTFDCYGTLIDWDGGIQHALEAVKGLAGCDLGRLRREREAAELELLAGPYRIYSGILGDSLKVAAVAQGRTLGYGEILGVVNSMSSWPPFPDSAKTLVRLAVRFVLAILTNAETKVLQTSAKRLGTLFVARITAEDIESYKPAAKHWEVAEKRLHLPRESILHVAASLVHDVRPARALGFPTVWINRRGEPVPEDVDPARVFPDLASLGEALLGPAEASAS
jgi:2-haloalkanoic acid dehalogenase type II